jgi:hypothetical protein
VAADVLRHVFRDPHEVAEHVNTDQALVHVTVAEQTRERVVFHVVCRPPTAFAAAGYAIEEARIVVPRQGNPRTYPVGAPRPWLHRNGPHGDLCLWFEGDPRGLRREWDDGFGAYVAIAHRHLFYEEFWRRDGRWPIEDAPHGPGEHRIVTLEMQWKAKLWTP